MKRVVLSLLLISSVYAGEFDNAMQAYKNGSFIEALNGFYILAKNGDVNAQYNVGLMYAQGQGAKQDTQKAMVWYEKAAKQGYAQAQYNLAEIYHNLGSVEPHAYEKARYWYEKAAQQGIMQAYNNLAALYMEGKGVTKSTEKAFKYLQKAAQMGDANAQLNLGIFYAWGTEGITEDKLKAYENLKGALKSGNFEAGKYLDRLCKESSWVCEIK
jgi:TPR repeat protein